MKTACLSAPELENFGRLFGIVQPERVTYMRWKVHCLTDEIENDSSLIFIATSPGESVPRLAEGDALTIEYPHGANESGMIIAHDTSIAILRDERAVEWRIREVRESRSPITELFQENWIVEGLAAAHAKPLPDMKE